MTAVHQLPDRSRRSKGASLRFPVQLGPTYYLSDKFMDYVQQDNAYLENRHLRVPLY